MENNDKYFHHAFEFQEIQKFLNIFDLQSFYTLIRMKLISHFYLKFCHLILKISGYLFEELSEN